VSSLFTSAALPRQIEELALMASMGEVLLQHIILDSAPLDPLLGGLWPTAARHEPIPIRHQLCGGSGQTAGTETPFSRKSETDCCRHKH
jgi:hypothetical protein